MVTTPKPVISCAGHEVLVSDFESQCMLTIASEPVLWRHSKHCSPYPVRFDAVITRWNTESSKSSVKALFNGRPVRPITSLQPLLYIFVMSNNHTLYTTGGFREKISSWLGHLQARNIHDWLILMIDADSQSNAAKVFAKSDVLQRIKHDFNVPSTGQHFLRIPDRRSVDGKAFHEAWTALIRSLRRIIMEVCHMTIKDYDEHIQILQDARGSRGWDFFEYLDREEELAQVYLILSGYEDALHEYYQIESLIRETIQQCTTEGNRPSWVEELASNTVSLSDSGSILSHFPVIDSSPNSFQHRAVRDRLANLFIVRSYLLSRELTLMSSLTWWHDIPSRTLYYINTTIEESRILQICSSPALECAWAFLCSLNCLELLFQWKPVDSKSDDLYHSLSHVVGAAFGHDGKHPALWRRPFVLRNSSLNDIKMAFPMDNVFLRVGETLNPVALPLANLVSSTYRCISTGGSALTSRSLSPFMSNKLLLEARLADVWVMAFYQLTQLGQRLSLWCPPDSQCPLDPAGQTIKSMVDQCTNSASTNHSAFYRSIHRELGNLFASRTIYAEIYVGLAQVLIGLLRLVDQPRKSVHVCGTLAEFLQHVNSISFAIDLYAVVSSVYLREGWSFLSARNYLQLACCLRRYIRQSKRKHGSQWLADPVSWDYLARQFDSCFALSCWSSMLLELTVNSLCRSASHASVPIVFVTGDDLLTFSDITSPDFWWSEALDVERYFSHDHVWVGTSALSSAIKVDSVELDGASENGFQLITVGVVVTAEVSFLAQIDVTAVIPTVPDWSSIMNYGLRDEEQRNLRSTFAGMSVVPLSDSVNLSVVENSSSLSPSSSRSSFYGSVQNLRSDKRAQQVAHSENGEGLVSGTDTKRRGSFLNVAASLATRASWKSQDQLQPSEGESIDANVNSAMLQVSAPNGVVDNSTAMSVGSFVATVSPLNSNRDDVKRSFSVSGSYNHPNGSTHKIGAQTGGAARRPSLVPLNSRTKQFFFTATTPSETISDWSFVTPAEPSPLTMLCPGLNRIQLTAKEPGFFLPQYVNVGIINRVSCSVSSAKPVRHSSSTQSQSLLHLSYRVQKQHFSPSWSNQILLDSLLPKVRNPSSTCETSVSFNTVLGLRGNVSLELQLGKLRLPCESLSGVHVYRLLLKSPTTPLLSRGTHRSLKLVNDYNVFDVPIMENLEPLIPTFSNFQCDYQDGPVSLLTTTDGQLDKTSTAYCLPHTSVQLARPISLSSLTDTDEFAITMPYGYLRRISVNVLRPLALSLSVYTFQRTDTVIIGIRVACFDIPTAPCTSTSSTPPLNKPPTFLLNKFDLVVVAPTLTSGTMTPRSTRSGSSVNPFDIIAVQLPAAPTPMELTSRLTAQNSTGSFSVPVDSIYGVPVDPRFTEARVNRLCPVTVLWRFRFGEFHPFVNSVMERFNEPPVAKFQCSFRRSDDPEYEAQLAFSRRISPIRQTNERSGSINSLLRNRRERAAN